MPISSQDERQDSVRFSGTVEPGKKEELTYDISKGARVEELRVRIYRGAELDLEVFPFIERGAGRREPLVTLAGREAIVGDADFFEFPVSVPVDEPQKVGVEAKHVGSEFPLDYQVTMVLDYEGGVDRGLFSMFRGWL